jgi:hypothetical protein
MEVVLKRLPDIIPPIHLELFIKTCRFTCVTINAKRDVWEQRLITIPNIYTKIINMFIRLMKIFFDSTRHLHPTDANLKLKQAFPLLPHLLLTHLTSYNPVVDGIHEILRDNGAFFKYSGQLFLIPVAFYNTIKVALPKERIVPPTHMFDLDDFDDIPFQADRPDHTCIIIKDGPHVHAYSVETSLLRRGINPRTPAWLFMRCKGPSHSLRMDDSTVFVHTLYLNLSKLGVTQVPYVNINEIKSALDDGHSCIIIQPKKEAGVKVVTQIASAYLYNVPQNVVSGSHCEVGHLGGLYDVYLPEL